MGGYKVIYVRGVEDLVSGGWGRAEFWEWVILFVKYYRLYSVWCEVGDF